MNLDKLPLGGKLDNALGFSKYLNNSSTSLLVIVFNIRSISASPLLKSFSVKPFLDKRSFVLVRKPVPLTTLIILVKALGLRSTLLIRSISSFLLGPSSCSDITC